MSNIILPSSPKDQKAIRNALSEIDVALTAIDAQKDHIKDILQMVQDNYDIPKKYTRRLASLMHKQKVQEAQSEASDLDALYETVVGADDE